MLTSQELEKLKQLIAGKRSPSDGMETHFLRVINGDALPCSPKEREWYEYWRQESGTVEEADDYREKYLEAIAALRQRDALIASLEEQLRELKETLKEKNALSLKEKDNTKDSQLIKQPAAATPIIPYLPTDNKWWPCHRCGGDGGAGGRCPRCGGNGFEPA